LERQSNFAERLLLVTALWAVVCFGATIWYYQKRNRNTSPEYYDRKIKTQRKRVDVIFLVEHVV